MKQFDSDTEDIPMSDDYKPTYIKEQHNNNCQQFFGPITNSTFVMPVASPAPKNKSKKTEPKIKPQRSKIDKPKTIKYFKHGNNSMLMKQTRCVKLVYLKWIEWKWINNNASYNASFEDFKSFFEGVPKHCNIEWTGPNTTILTILLQELLKQPYIEKQTGISAKSLVTEQFKATPSSAKGRLDSDAEDKIRITLFLLDIRNLELLKRDAYTGGLIENEEREEFGINDYDIDDSSLLEFLSSNGVHVGKSV